MELMKCPNCGKEIIYKAATCIYCGNPLPQIKKDKSKIIRIIKK